MDLKARNMVHSSKAGEYRQRGFIGKRGARKTRSYLGAYIVGLVLLALLANLAYYLS